ncbi:hypothetical protein BLNAU_1842 [Blattamonas nauphoetae]|uniref:Uncharacterized protein n=1 Tax=Blattamonas nauphoetae TaxID=2049346 RepID=A0ABQ9YHV1_9EUKA|nr:hypothetical protein BLNAU_1842 [Blattamonas nauphoetae]
MTAQFLPFSFATYVQQCPASPVTAQTALFETQFKGRIIKWSLHCEQSSPDRALFRDTASDPSKPFQIILLPKTGQLPSFQANTAPWITAELDACNSQQLTLVYSPSIHPDSVSPITFSRFRENILNEQKVYNFALSAFWAKVNLSIIGVLQNITGSFNRTDTGQNFEASAQFIVQDPLHNNDIEPVIIYVPAGSVQLAQQLRQINPTLSVEIVAQPMDKVGGKHHMALVRIVQYIDQDYPYPKGKGQSQSSSFSPAISAIPQHLTQSIRPSHTQLPPSQFNPSIPSGAPAGDNRELEAVKHELEQVREERDRIQVERDQIFSQFVTHNSSSQGQMAEIERMKEESAQKSLTINRLQELLDEQRLETEKNGNELKALKLKFANISAISEETTQRIADQAAQLEELKLQARVAATNQQYAQKMEEVNNELQASLFISRGKEMAYQRKITELEEDLPKWKQLFETSNPQPTRTLSQQEIANLQAELSQLKQINKELHERLQKQKDNATQMSILVHTMTSQLEQAGITPIRQPQQETRSTLSSYPSSSSRSHPERVEPDIQRYQTTREGRTDVRSTLPGYESRSAVPAHDMWMSVSNPSRKPKQTAPPIQSNQPSSTPTTTRSDLQEAYAFNRIHLIPNIPFGTTRNQLVEELEKSREINSHVTNVFIENTKVVKERDLCGVIIYESAEDRKEQGNHNTLHIFNKAVQLRTAKGWKDIPTLLHYFLSASCPAMPIKASFIKQSTHIDKPPNTQPKPPVTNPKTTSRQENEIKTNIPVPKNKKQSANQIQGKPKGGGRTEQNAEDNDKQGERINISSLRREDFKSEGKPIVQESILPAPKPKANKSKIITSFTPNQDPDVTQVSKLDHPDETSHKTSNQSQSKIDKETNKHDERQMTPWEKKKAEKDKLPPTTVVQPQKIDPLILEFRRKQEEKERKLKLQAQQGPKQKLKENPLISWTPADTPKPLISETPQRTDHHNSDEKHPEGEGEKKGQFTFKGIDLRGKDEPRPNWRQKIENNRDLQLRSQKEENENRKRILEKQEDEQNAKEVLDRLKLSTHESESDSDSLAPPEGLLLEDEESESEASQQAHDETDFETAAVFDLSTSQLAKYIEQYDPLDSSQIDTASMPTSLKHLFQLEPSPPGALLSSSLFHPSRLCLSYSLWNADIGSCLCALINTQSFLFKRSILLPASVHLIASPQFSITPSQIKQDIFTSLQHTHSISFSETYPEPLAPSTPIPSPITLTITLKPTQTPSLALWNSACYLWDLHNLTPIKIDNPTYIVNLEKVLHNNPVEEIQRDLRWDEQVEDEDKSSRIEWLKDVDVDGLIRFLSELPTLKKISPFSSLSLYSLPGTLFSLSNKPTITGSSFSSRLLALLQGRMVKRAYPGFTCLYADDEKEEEKRKEEERKRKEENPDEEKPDSGPSNEHDAYQQTIEQKRLNRERRIRKEESTLEQEANVAFSLFDWIVFDEDQEEAKFGEGRKEWMEKVRAKEEDELFTNCLFVVEGHVDNLPTLIPPAIFLPLTSTHTILLVPPSALHLLPSDLLLHSSTSTSHPFTKTQLLETVQREMKKQKLFPVRFDDALAEVIVAMGLWVVGDEKKEEPTKEQPTEVSKDQIEKAKQAKSKSKHHTSSLLRFFLSSHPAICQIHLHPPQAPATTTPVSGSALSLLSSSFLSRVIDEAGEVSGTSSAEPLTLNAQVLLEGIVNAIAHSDYEMVSGGEEAEAELKKEEERKKKKEEEAALNPPSDQNWDSILPTSDQLSILSTKDDTKPKKNLSPLLSIHIYPLQLVMSNPCSFHPSTSISSSSLLSPLSFSPNPLIVSALVRFGLMSGTGCGRGIRSFTSLHFGMPPPRAIVVMSEEGTAPVHAQWLQMLYPALTPPGQPTKMQELFRHVQKLSWEAVHADYKMLYGSGQGTAMNEIVVLQAMNGIRPMIETAAFVAMSTETSHFEAGISSTLVEQHLGTHGWNAMLEISNRLGPLSPVEFVDTNNPTAFGYTAQVTGCRLNRIIRDYLNGHRTSLNLDTEDYFHPQQARGASLYPAMTSHSQYPHGPQMSTQPSMPTH